MNITKRVWEKIFGWEIENRVMSLFYLGECPPLGLPRKKRGTVKRVIRWKDGNTSLLVCWDNPNPYEYLTSWIKEEDVEKIFDR